MLLSHFSLDRLREKIETGGSFDIIITPVFPRLLDRVQQEAKTLHCLLESQGYSVLLDDRNQKPKNMFRVAAFLQIPNRLTVSNRSIKAGVYEYFDLKTEERYKVPIDEVSHFLQNRIAQEVNDTSQ